MTSTEQLEKEVTKFDEEIDQLRKIKEKATQAWMATDLDFRQLKFTLANQKAYEQFLDSQLRAKKATRKDLLSILGERSQ